MEKEEQVERGCGGGPPIKSTTREWHPIELLESAIIAGQVVRSGHGCGKKYAIILLNQAVLNEELFLSLWNEATVRILVDGGGNHWRLLSRKFPDLVQLPDIVCGNFDSISRDTLELFQRRGEEVEIKKFSEPVGKESDFTQALNMIMGRIGEAIKVKEGDPSKFTGISRIFVYNETSGRLDQVMANIETLYKCCGATPTGPPTTQVFLICSTSLTFLLPGGKHRILAARRAHSFIKISHCALLPVGERSTVSTKGLRHDLAQETLAFGTKVVTNNEVVGVEDSLDYFMATVTNTAPILWTMGIHFDNQMRNVW